MSFLGTVSQVWSSVTSPVVLPFPLSYVPLVCRSLAIVIAAPFLLSIALELIAYVIARTLHISIERLRVPRSPPPAEPRDLDDEDDNLARDPLDSSLPVPETSSAETSSPFAKAFGRAVSTRTSTYTLLFSSAIVVGIAVLVQVISSQSISNLDGLVTVPDPVALILTAHPDDEAMFFAPTVLNLIAAGWGVLGVCMSTGNADGLGYQRALELQSSYSRLGVPIENVTIFDNADLQDGSSSWDPALVAELIAPIVEDRGVTLLITFDDGGITQHPNHVALAGVPKLLSTRSLVLQSPSVLAKFTGPLYALYAGWLNTFDYAEALAIVASPRQYLEALHAMQAHWSQMVWFRWLYVSFSHLMWVNELVEV